MKGIKIKKSFLLLLIGVLIPIACFSQDNNGNYQPPPNPALVPLPPPPEEIFYRGSLEGGGGAVFPVTNKALGISLTGVYYVHFSANYVMAPHIFAGLELEDTQLGSTASIAAFGTLMFIYGGGLKMGYYTYMQHDFLFCYSISAGPCLITYTGAPNPAPKGGYRQQSFFMTPNLLASYRVNDELRVGLEFSYIFLDYVFNPTYTGISKYINYTPSDAKAITTYGEIGFEIYWAFAEHRK